MLTTVPVLLGFVINLLGSPVPGQGPAAAEQADRQTLKTRSASRCRTEDRTLQETPPSKQFQVTILTSKKSRSTLGHIQTHINLAIITV